MDDFIRKFRNGLIRPEVEKHMQTRREYAAGDLATITDGALKDRTVLVEEIAGDLAWFTIEFFNGERRLSLPLDHLAAA